MTSECICLPFAQSSGNLCPKCVMDLEAEVKKISAAARIARSDEADGRYLNHMGTYSLK